MLFILSSPSGGGKTTLLKRLVKEQSSAVANISYTTRPKRANEEEGKDYFFVSKETFLEKQKRGDILESVNIFDNFYGTSKAFIERADKDVICALEPNGALYLYKTFKKKTVILIFIMPPNIEELEARLRHRGEDRLHARLHQAKEQIAKKQFYHYHVVNADLEKSYGVIEAIYIAERAKNRDFMEDI